MFMFLAFMSELSNYGKIYKNLKDDEINLGKLFECQYLLSYFVSLE